MNTGAFGEGFPYSNFHDLNMDWIIKIAKDFLDQYTHIQEIIEQGETNIQDLTDTGLDQLQDKADALTELLQDWYDTHSDDIADQLADALADLNEWYTTHQNYLDQTLANNISAFNTSAQTKTAELLETIPADYADLYNMVMNIYGVACQLLTITSMLWQSGYIDTSGAEVANASYVRSYFIPIQGSRDNIIKYYNFWGNTDTVNIVSAYDSEKTYIANSGIVSTGSYQSDEYLIPSGAKYVRFSTLKTYVDDGTTKLVITPNTTYHLWSIGTFLVPAINGTRYFEFNGYINAGHSFYGNDYFTRTDYIPAKEGDIFEYFNLMGNANAISIVAIFDVDKQPLTHIQSTGSFQSGEITMPKDGYIMFCCNKTYINNGTAYIKYKYSYNDLYSTNTQKMRYTVNKVSLCTIGDSITRQSWTADAKWQNKVIDELHMNSTYQNLGFDAKMVSGASGLWTDDVIDQIDLSSLIITVLAGVNDWAGNIVIGNRTIDNTDTNTFFGACNTMFQKIQTKHSNARIIAFGCMFARIPNKAEFPDAIGYKNGQGLTSIDYAIAMMESANLNGVEHYCIGGNLGIGRGNYLDGYYRDEGYYVHPSEKLTNLMAAYIARCIG